MKLSLAVLATVIGFSQAFTAAPRSTGTSSTQLLAAPLNRRELVNQVAALTLAGVVVGPQAAFAQGYEPKFDDVKQIYILGKSLDRLVDKLNDPDQVEAGLTGVVMFNKDVGFYPGYAKNYVLKLVKTGADKDSRVGYIKQVSD
jgi:hypothetical protein